MKITTYSFLFLFSLASLISCNTKNREVKNTNGQQLNITKAEALKLMSTNKDIVFLDVRTPVEIVGGKIIDSALEIDFRSDGFKEKIQTLDKDKEYIVYCKSGGRSSKATDIMQQEGFQNIHNLLGGYSGW